MSRQIDPYNLDDADFDYLAQRPLLVKEFGMQGFPLPVLVEGGKVVRNPDYEDELANMGDESDEEPEENPEAWKLDQLPENQQWSSGDKKADLEAVVAERNSHRDEGAQQVMVNGENKDDIVNALKADDEWLLEVMNGSDEG